MKSNSRIVIISILLLFLSTFLVGATYAWFSNNDDVLATDLSLKVKTVQYLEVSTDAKNWYQQVTLNNIVNADYDVERKNQTPLAFEPVSTAGDITSGNLKMFKGKSELDRDTTSPTYGQLLVSSVPSVEVDGEHGSFMTFDLYFKTTMPKKVYLGRDSFVTHKSTSNAGVSNAIRVGFVNEGTTSSEVPVDAQNLKTSNKNNVVIWEPNYNRHTDEAILNAQTYYGLTLTNDMSSHVDYLGIKNTITTPMVCTSNDPNYFSSIKYLIKTDSDFATEDGDNIALFDVGIGISKIRIYVWVEGQDVDCINDISGSDFNINLNFATNRNPRDASK